MKYGNQSRAERHVDAERDGRRATSDACRSRRTPYSIWNSNCVLRRCLRAAANAFVSRRSSPDRASQSPGTCRRAAALHQLDERRVDFGSSAGTRRRAARDRRPSPAGRARRARFTRWTSALGPLEARLHHDADVPVADAPDRLEGVERASVYAELSMSIRTKKSPGVAASSTRRRLSMHVARSMSRPSCVSFSEIVAADAGALDLADRSRRRRAWRRAASSTNDTLSPSKSSVTRQAAALDRARGFDGLGDVLAGDEPAREAARARACRSGTPAFQRRTAGEHREHGSGERTRASVRRPSRALTRCWIVRA